jgi:hypothetical protein
MIFYRFYKNQQNTFYYLRNFIEVLRQICDSHIHPWFA